MGYDWVDADVEVELAAGKSIADIFRRVGRSWTFRDWNREVLQLNCVSAKRLFALGGGVVLAEDQPRVLKQCASASSG